jgi:aryl-alcohol dehydrogenase-like predicted oxidoreductase
MNYRNLGRTGIKVSELCLGCMNFGGKTELEDSCAIIGQALEAGINFLDTANVYSRGRSEEFVGEALQRLGARDRVVLATKVHGRMEDDDPNAFGNSRRHIVAQCEASLRRLKTDRIDLYQIHRPQSDIPIDETLRALDDLIRAGKVLHIGTSTFAAWQLMESLMVSRELGLNRFICDQAPYNLLDRRIERELVPFALSYGLAIIPWSPLGGGLLSGQYTRENPKPEGARYASDAPHLKARMKEGLFDHLDALFHLANERGCPPSQIALAWCLQRPGVTSPIIGPRTASHLGDNLAALEIKLTPEELEVLDQAFPPGRMISPFYEADFGPSKWR